MVTTITQNKDGSYTKSVDGKTYIINKSDSRYGRIGGEYATQQGYGKGAGGVDTSGSVYGNGGAVLSGSGPSGAGSVTASSPGSLSGGSRFSLSGFRAKMGNPMSMEQAYGYAGKELNPIFDKYRTDAGAVAQQQSALLNQQLAARGQARGGLMADRQADLSGQLLNTLADYDTQKASQLASRAADLQNTSFNQASQTFNNNLNAWQTQNSLGLQQQQLNDANSQYNQNFAYQQVRDSIADEQRKAQFDEDVRRYGLDFGLQKLQADRDWQLSNQQLSLQRAAVSGGGSSGSSGGSSGGTGGGSSTGGLTPSQRADIREQATKLAANDTNALGENGTSLSFEQKVYKYEDQLMAPYRVGQYQAAFTALQSMTPEQAFSTLSQNRDTFIEQLGYTDYMNLYNSYAKYR